eukprot:TRINITY_DN19004_c0_g1_i1.p1 TRINITY_DN19004_c0_g1~~TRINITY_DN19004_c0_g1_i1.p1  ORF type:complete len:457 (-),score=111.15 TRINITY_DN19004_c0_g1_i1:187-1557(-)
MAAFQRAVAQRFSRAAEKEARRLAAGWTGATVAPPDGAARVGAGIGRLSNMVIERGEGCWVWNTAGEKYLDLATGIGVVNLGHRHPKVQAAVHAQVDKIWHAQVNIAHHKNMLDLTEKLEGIMPAGSDLNSFLFVTTGSEAVEAAVKLARHASKKPNIIVFQGGYHGRTLLTASMTTSKTIYRGGYGPHSAGIHVAPFPYYYERQGQDIGNPVEWTMQQLELLIQQQTTPDETAAIILEPVLGEGGYVPAPPGLFQELRKLCDKHGILLIADEVQSGFGRTGKMFAIEHMQTKPDIMVFAKGIASGFPIAGIASRKELTDRQPPGSQGGTYAGNAVACAAALATIDVMTSQGFLANVDERGRQFQDGFRALQSEGLAPIVDVRGLGLMIGIEFDTSRVDKGYASKVSKACMDHGMIVLSTGIFETLRLIPPLTISADEVDHALKTFRQVFKHLQES